ncbi:hypothetical protein, partial [uncultured Bradyrhizobium sp.]|uniref:hypothetical protein n=1 Tax=uncultured Bradyrhizobium sp. TaxID=199684 RepID=UPI002625354A
AAAERAPRLTARADLRESGHFSYANAVRAQSRMFLASARAASSQARKNSIFPRENAVASVLRAVLRSLPPEGRLQ